MGFWCYLNGPQSKGLQTKGADIHSVRDGLLAVPEMGGAIVDNLELRKWHLRDEASFAQTGVGGLAVGNELPAVRVI